MRLRFLSLGVTGIIVLGAVICLAGCGGGDGSSESSGQETGGGTESGGTAESVGGTETGTSQGSIGETAQSTDQGFTGGDGEIDTIDEAVFALQISLTESYLAFSRAVVRLRGQPGEATIPGIINGLAIVQIDTFTDTAWAFDVTFNEYSTLYPQVTQDGGPLSYLLTVSQDPPSQSGTMKGTVTYSGLLSGDATFDITLSAECNTADCTDEIIYSVEGSVNEFDVNVSFTCNVQTGECTPA
ncbi:MAG: hypothetical protein D6795_01810 [Deltaproteobacteria bacterium]|nr:MAG: hypothetical protein D6795_01810 [Deltaproteobacteria bacterium]